MARKSCLFLVAGILAVTLIAGYVPALAEEHWSVGMSKNPCLTIDPGTGYSGSMTHCAHLHVFEPLLAEEPIVKPDGTRAFKTIPVLATGYKWVDPIHIRFKLRKGVKFHNGEDFTAEDVKYTFDYYMKMPLGGRYRWIGYIGKYSDVRIIDKYTVEFILKKPDADAINSLEYFVILPKSRGWTKESVAAFKKNPVGTGPYKIKKLEVDQYWELEAWEDYRDGIVRPKYLTIKYIPEPSARLAALLTGEVEIIEAPAPEHLPRIKANPDFAISTIEAQKNFCYLLQYYKPPFNDVRVRRAVNYAVDRFTIADKLLEGKAKPIPTFIYPPMLGGLPDLKPYPYDPEKAKQLLADAGYPGGFGCEIQCTSGEHIKDLEVAQTVQAYLADVGIKARIKPVESAERFENFYPGNFDMQMAVWGIGSHTPWKVMRWNLLYYKQLKSTPGGAMPEGMDKIHELWGKVGVEADRAKQEEMFKEINRLLHDQAGCLFLYALDVDKAYNKAKIGKWEAIQTYYDLYVWYYDYRGKYPAGRKVEWEKVD